MAHETASRSDLQARPIANNLITWPSDQPQLVGSICGDCGARTFPAQGHCPRCTSTAMSEVLLPRTGTLWTWTVQGFRPKSPPYIGPEQFEPFGVGYVDLNGELLVETRLTESDPGRIQIGAEMELVVVPVFTGEDGTDVVTYAFRPVEAPG